MSADAGGAAVKQSGQLQQKIQQSKDPAVSGKMKANGKDVTANKIEDALKKANDMAQNVFNRSLKFSVDKETKEMVVKVVDSDTGKVVRQIPPEDMLKFIERFDKARALLYSEEH